ncbi:putative lysine acetyltransferase protein [Eutypa lata UCREL1]|uniref:Putative lysine acetyltransferase protein n=1 Tax=Eutypa lata (strain UCR-EL1) TaxID=1287681 RepID=M7T4U9_EUTLA|nr:putative lysine acetyltransferase protein [Eutypa lata UCREL1]
MGSQTTTNDNNNGGTSNPPPSSPPPPPPPPLQLPDATSETLVLTRATDEEKSRTWTFNYREWGGALSLDQYLLREPYVATIPLARDGGMTHWVLTTKPKSSAEGEEGEEKEGDITSSTTSTTTRPVLASCESIRKRVLVARPPLQGGGGGGGDDAEGDVPVIRDAVAYGIGSVYTYPEFRGRSYAKRMLKELGTTLKTWPVLQPEGKANGGDGKPEEHEHAVCTALWSDIGKVFYAKKGWHPFPSVHVTFPAAAAVTTNNVSTSTSTSSKSNKTPLEPITYANLASFTAHDEALLRQRLARTAARTRKTAFAFAPDHDALRWHLYRDAFVASFVHTSNNGNENNKGGTPVPPQPPSSASSSLSEQKEKGEGEGEVAGEMKRKGVVAEVVAIAADGQGQQRRRRRIWAIWARNYQAGLEDPARNTLYILRLVVEGADEDAGQQEEEGEEEEEEALKEALASVLDAARAEAARWGCARVDLWNPTPLVRRLLARIGDGALPRQWVDRDTDSIPSLMWYGGDGDQEVEWVANEKYCWC